MEDGAVNTHPQADKVLQTKKGTGRNTAEVVNSHFSKRIFKWAVRPKASPPHQESKSNFRETPELAG